MVAVEMGWACGLLRGKNRGACAGGRLEGARRGACI